MGGVLSRGVRRIAFCIIHIPQSTGSRLSVFDKEPKCGPVRAAAVSQQYSIGIYRPRSSCHSVGITVPPECLADCSRPVHPGWYRTPCRGTGAWAMLGRPDARQTFRSRVCFQHRLQTPDPVRSLGDLIDDKHECAVQSLDWLSAPRPYKCYLSGIRSLCCAACSWHPSIPTEVAAELRDAASKFAVPLRANLEFLVIV
jgi:hypothetical protein